MVDNSAMERYRPLRATSLSAAPYLNFMRFMSADRAISPSQLPSASGVSIR